MCALTPPNSIGQLIESTSGSLPSAAACFDFSLSFLCLAWSGVVVPGTWPTFAATPSTPEMQLPASQCLLQLYYPLPKHSKVRQSQANQSATSFSLSLSQSGSSTASLSLSLYSSLFSNISSSFSPPLYLLFPHPFAGRQLDFNLRPKTLERLFYGLFLQLVRLVYCGIFSHSILASI